VLSRRALTCLAATAAVAVPAATGSAAQLGLQDDRLGVTPAADVPARVGLLASTGTRLTRVDLFWSRVAPTRPADARNPADPAYDWSQADAVFAQLAARGITPIVAVYGTPGWAARGGRVTAFPNPVAPARAADYADFMAAAAARYRGTYVPAGAAAPLPAVTLWEIWNEPNLSVFLTPQRAGGRPASPGIYIGLVRAAHPAIKAANPAARVLVGSTGPTDTTGAASVGTTAWLEALRRARPPMDAYSQHIYPKAAPTQRTKAVPAWATLPALLAKVNRIRRGMPVYITEAGYTTGTTRYRKVKVTRAQQAAYLRQVVNLPVTRRPQVKAIIWFNLQDNVNWPGGLLDVAGNRKPAWGVFTRMVARHG
jgi:hypothetical protein